MASNELVVERSIKNTLPKDLTTVDKGNFQQLKTVANTFISNIQLLYQQTVRTSAIIQKDNLKNGLQYFYQYMRSSKNFLQNILQWQEYFEKELNNFLGRTIYLAWVDSKSGNIMYFDDAAIGLLYEKATRQYGRGNVSASKVRSMIESEHLAQDLKQRLKESQEKRRYVYLEIIRRWKEPKNDKRFYYKNPQRRKYTIQFTNKGPIAEGYAGAVINENPNVGPELQTSIKTLYLEHINLDSIPAIIKGDIVWTENGNIQFAVKQGSFSTARFGQYLALAYNIKDLPPLTIQDFQNKLPELIQINTAVNNILTNLFNQVKQELDNNIKQIAPLT